MGEAPSLDLAAVILGLLGGLALFLFGMTRVSETLEQLGGDRVRDWLSRCTSNPVLGFLTGIVATALLDSSSFVMVLLIALVDARLMRFEHALAVVLGANIGTTVSSQVFALDIGRYAPAALVAGLAVQLISKAGRARQTGRLVFDFGLLFFGLHHMGSAALPLRESETFLRWMREMENPLSGILTAGAFTAIIQSSSATLGILIQMAGHGLITARAGMAMMMGAEIGTCGTSLLASIGRSRTAVRVAAFHVAFNVASVAAGLALFEPFTRLVTAIPPAAPSHQIANAHVMFNALGAVAALAFVRTAAAAMRKLIPDPPQEQYPQALAEPSSI